MDHGTTYIILSLIFGFFMAWGIGANDVANAMGTSVGSKIFTLKQAIVVATIFEFLGSLLAGGGVTETISSGITNVHLFVNNDLLIFGMLSALLSSAIWLLVATNYGWPVSTTHSIVGAIVGFTLVCIGPSAVKWSAIGEIVLSWVISPVLGGVFAYLIFMSVQKLILNTEQPFIKAKKYVPFYIFLVAFFLSLITLTKGLKHLNLNLTIIHSLIISSSIGIVLSIIGVFLLRRIEFDPNADKDFHFANVEKIFGIMMIFTACSMAFAHGSNDVANAVGPLAAVINIVTHKGLNNPNNFKVLLLGGVGIVLGLATFGYKVIDTIGKHITELTPSRGFAAEFSAALTVVSASGLGLPISTTHTLVGAILGVGFARGIGALNMKVIHKIFSSWVITLPVGATLSIIFFYILKYIFTG